MYVRKSTYKNVQRRGKKRRLEKGERSNCHQEHALYANVRTRKYVKTVRTSYVQMTWDSSPEILVHKITYHQNRVRILYLRFVREKFTYGYVQVGDVRSAMVDMLSIETLIMYS